MLKWAVMARRDADQPDASRRASAAVGTFAGTGSSTFHPKSKRRRSSTTPRRSSISRPPIHLKRDSLDLDVDKENQFTSTPIKSLEDHHQCGDVLRDVSNLTPKDQHKRRLLSAKKSAEIERSQKKKKKKDCKDPFHSENYFRPFETVDSHIMGVLEDDEDHTVCNTVKKETRRYPDYAPTLPNLQYSPCLVTPILSTPRLLSFNTRVIPETEDGHHPCKRPKIDHVNDFLHRISVVPALEDEELAPLELKTNARLPLEEVKVSPLVRKFVDLRFGKELMTAVKPRAVDDGASSFIDDLSLDQIVNAILNSSAEEMDENYLNETKEENLINTANERRQVGSFGRCSPDSGFKSSAADNSHQLEGNFVCKCSNNNLPAVDPLANKTIINIEEPFNERCVDEVNPRKRPSTTPYEVLQSLDNSDNPAEDVNFTLKRQRCIRRRKQDHEGTASSTKFKPSSPIITTNATKDDDQFLNGNSSGDSIISGRISDDNKSTPLKTSERKRNGAGDDVLMLSAPADSGSSRRFRRCLLFESPSSSSFSETVSSTNCSIGDIRGSVDLHIFEEDGTLNVNVIRCKDLYRPSGKQINAYVKVALSDRIGNSRRKGNGLLQRTAVQSDSSKPFFNHTFKLPLQDEDSQKRLHIEVWHRDRISRTSEFLGCMSFDAKHACKKDINGSYRLLPQSTGRCQNVAITLPQDTTQSELVQRTKMELPPSTLCQDSQSSVEEAVSLDLDLDSDLKKTTSKAILNEQQKHADENLFLRYLELDPLEGPEAIPAATQRKATGNKNGRTPFTQTKRLTRAPKSGFGFSVVWTHPPRIERVEKGLPAERAGILPGDYVIFVDKHNVVMMPEIDILNLIRSFGSQLTLEIFRRNSSRNGSVPSVRRLNSTGTCSTAGLPVASSNLVQRRPSTVCSTTNTTSVDYNRRKLHLPQVTFSAEKPTSNQDENRKKTMYQLIHKEQQYATGLQFAVTRFVSALAERKDLITPSEHKVLFQNVDEILRITEDILDNLVQDDGELQIHTLARTYHAKLGEITSAYKRYCSGIKKADCVLANKSKNSNSEFARFLQTPSIPRRRPDMTTFIHKPLEHYREVLKLLTVIQSSTKPNHEDLPVINQVVHDLQVTYREITSEAGLMEPVGEGRPLLTVQDLENRLVFTKCKPFVLSKPGRQWIFGGDLSRVEGRNVRQYWTLLFSDLLLFAKVSRDRVLFIIEDPLPLAHVSDMFFNIRKKDTEFRITIVPGGRSATSPTVHCGPDLSRTPKKSAGKRVVVLRAPTTELKAVWQNLLQRQIFQINSGMDGSSFSSPLESPDAPITSSVATLQSAESLSFHRRQTPQNLNDNPQQNQIDALIEHKCKQLSKNSAKGNAIHLEKWMKGQLDNADEAEMEPLTEEWTEEMLRKRSEELQLIDCQGNITSRVEGIRRNDSRCEESNLSDHDQSPSKSTTTESQVTVRSSPLVPETVPVCRQCHKNCISNVRLNCTANNNQRMDETEEDDWRPLLLMGLSAINPAASLVKLDPFAAPVTRSNDITENQNYNNTMINGQQHEPCCCRANIAKINSIDLVKLEAEFTPDDSPQTDEPPYHSLSSSNLTLRRFGTVSSLERFGSGDANENWEENHNNSSGSEEAEDEREDDEDEEDEVQGGIDNDAFYQSSILSWTAKAGSFVAEKMAFLEDYRNSGKFFERYLKTAEVTVNGEEVQEDEISGATSGEEIWGTPTSGGEIDDPLSSPNYEGKQSPYDGSISSDNGDDTELMMDELLMTPPITGAVMRGLLPRRTLEPLIEEDFSETYSSTSSTSPTEPSVSPDQGNETGDVADTCSTAAEDHLTAKTPEAEKRVVPSVVVTSETNVVSKIHRSESYRRIVEAAEDDDDDNLGFFSRFKPTVKFINVERVPRTKSVRIFEFFHMRRERRIHQSIPEGKQLIKLFSKEGEISDSVPTNSAEKPTSPRRLKDKQLDRRFWKQLSKRRGNKMSSPPQI